MPNQFFDPDLIRGAKKGAVAESYGNPAYGGAVSSAVAPGMSGRDMFFQQYGTSTPQEVVRNAGLGPNSGATANATTPAQSGSSPAGAVGPDTRSQRIARGRALTEMHHAVPGSVNGNPADGQTSAEMGVGPTFRGGGVGAGTGAATGMQQPTIAPATATPAATPAPAASPAAPASAADQAAAAMLGQTAASPLVAPATTTAAATPRAAVSTGQQSVGLVSETPKGATNATKAAAYQVTTGGKSYAVTKEKPANWGAMTSAQRDAWVLRNSATPGSATKWSDYNAQVGGGAQGGEPQNSGTTTTGTGTTTQPGVQSPTATAQTPTDDAAGSGTGAGKMVSEEPKAGTDPGQSGQGANWGTGSYDDIQNAIFGSGQGSWTKNFYSSGLGLSEGEINRITNNGKDKLKNPNQLGPMRLIRVEGATLPDEFYDPKSAQGVQDDGARALATYVETRVALLLQNRANSDLSTAQRQSVEAALTKKIRTATTALSAYNVFWDPLAAIGQGGDEVDSAGGTQGYTDEQGRYHLSTSEANYSNPSTWDSGMKNFLVGGNALKPAERLAIMEFMGQKEQVGRGMEQQNVAYQNASDTLEANLDDPAFKQFQEGALDAYGNPILSDWAGIRARDISSTDKGLQTAAQSLARTSGRRGVSTGTAAEMGTRLGMDARAQQASRLGELSVKETDERRAEQDRGMAYLQGSAGMGASIRSAGDAARNQILMGEAPTGKTGLEGAANVGSSFYAQELSRRALEDAEDQASKADDFTLKDGVGIIADLFGGFGG